MNQQLASFGVELGRAPLASLTLALTGTALTEATAPDLAARLQREACAMVPLLTQLRL